MRIEYWWDTQDPDNAGWYARMLDDDGQTVDDSMKVWFRVNVDDYAESDGDALHDALVAAYPDAEVTP